MMLHLGNFEFRDGEINGDVNIDNHSVVVFQSATTVNGNVALERDSGITLEGPVTITGSVDCEDEESSFFSTEDPPNVGSLNCSGF